MAWTKAGNIAGPAGVVAVLDPEEPVPAETPAGLIVRLAED